MDAFCAFASCDLAHAHDALAAKTALLLKLTKGQPYVLTYCAGNRRGRDPVLRSAYRRADTILVHSRENASDARELCKAVPTYIAGASAYDASAPLCTAHKVASEHLRIYRNVIDRGSVPDLLL